MKGLIAMAAETDEILNHDYDGIQEYDNPLPGWWKWLFILSILFTPPYFFFYHNGAEGRSLADRYDRQLAANLRGGQRIRRHTPRRCRSVGYDERLWSVLGQNQRCEQRRTVPPRLQQSSPRRRAVRDRRRLGALPFGDD